MNDLILCWIEFSRRRAKRSVHIPLGVMAGLRLSLDYARRGCEVDECRALAGAAALRADDVGLDEYEGNEGRLDELFAVSEVFVLKDARLQHLIEDKRRGVEQSSDDSIKACIAIRPGYYCRSDSTSLRHKLNRYVRKLNVKRNLNDTNFLFSETN